MKTSHAHQVFIAFIAAMLIAVAIAGSGLYGISSLQNGLERMSAKLNSRPAAEADRVQNSTFRAETAGLDSDLGTTQILGLPAFIDGIVSGRTVEVNGRALICKLSCNGMGVKLLMSSSSTIFPDY